MGVYSDKNDGLSSIFTVKAECTALVPRHPRKTFKNSIREISQVSPLQFNWHFFLLFLLIYF